MVSGPEVPIIVAAEPKHSALAVAGTARKRRTRAADRASNRRPLIRPSMDKT
jgi:hypothetical protein